MAHVENQFDEVVAENKTLVAENNTLRSRVLELEEEVHLLRLQHDPKAHGDDHSSGGHASSSIIAVQPLDDVVSVQTRFGRLVIKSSRLSPKWPNPKPHNRKKTKKT